MGKNQFQVNQQSSPILSEVSLKGEIKLSVPFIRFINMILFVGANSYDPTLHVVSVNFPLNILQRITDHQI